MVVLPPSIHAHAVSQGLFLTGAHDSGVRHSSSASVRNTSESTHSIVTTSRTHQSLDLPLSSHLVQSSIQAAIASIGEGRINSLDSNAFESDNRTAESRTKMCADNSVAQLKKPRRKRTPQGKSGQTSGRWTQQEHQAFLEGLQECGREWKKVAMRIPTRTSAQIRSHAQKYFSKIQRDHESAFLPDLSATYSSGYATASIPSTDDQSLTPSVQRNVDRLLANPVAMQEEVQNTLVALRERYRQLQVRLEQRHEQRSGRDSPRSTKHHTVPDDDPQISCCLSTRKRHLADTDARAGLASFSSNSHDDHSSICSNVSASVASMEDDELIALHVLRGALPRGESSQHVERVGESYSSDVSIASSRATAHNDLNQRIELLEENEGRLDRTSAEHDENPVSKRPKSK